MSKTIPLSFDEAVLKVTDELQKEGFGVITRIDIRETMKQKIGADVRPYMILGACNPHLAHRALSAEPELGLLLPCNVIVYTDQDGHTHVSLFDPTVMSAIISNPSLKPVAEEVKERFDRIYNALN